MGDPGFAAGCSYHRIGQLQHRVLDRIADVHRTGMTILVHQPQHSLDQITHIAEGSSLQSVSINCQIFALQGLDDEVRNDTAIIRAPFEGRRY